MSKIALIIIDYQEDFCEGGTLPVSGARELCPSLNRAIAEAIDQNWIIVLTRDWHPANHSSFEEYGGPWPSHCVQNTEGAGFTEGLSIPESAIVVSKGSTVEGMGYSPFEEDRLQKALRSLSVSTLVIVGVALEYCVLMTCKEASAGGYTTFAVRPLILSVSQETQLVQNAWNEIKDCGCIVVDTLAKCSLDRF